MLSIKACPFVYGDSISRRPSLSTYCHLDWPFRYSSNSTNTPFPFVSRYGCLYWQDQPVLSMETLEAIDRTLAKMNTPIPRKPFTVDQKNNPRNTQIPGHGIEPALKHSHGNQLWTSWVRDTAVAYLALMQTPYLNPWPYSCPLDEFRNGESFSAGTFC